MATYVYDEEQRRMVDKKTGEPMNPPDSKWRPVTPTVYGDLPGYQSPIDGSWVEGRRARRYDMESNDCIDANELDRKTDGTLKNKRFAKKHRLENLLKPE